MPTLCPPARNGGLTLAEVLVALTLLGVFLLPAMIAFSQGLVTTSDAAITAAAASIARDKVEELKVLDFSELGSQVRQTRDLRPGDSFFEVAVTVEVIRPDDSVHSGLKKAEVAVYQAGGRRPVAVATTYFVPFGV